MYVTCQVMLLRGIHIAQEDGRQTSSVQAKASAEHKLQEKTAMAKSIIAGVDKVRGFLSACQTGTAWLPSADSRHVSRNRDTHPAMSSEERTSCD